MLEGEAGIGKTTIWEAGVAAARESPGWVLVSRPAEAEAALGFAGLSDLFEPLPDEVFAALPEPRRHALEVALLRAPARGRGDVRAVAAAVRDVLGELAAIGRVIVAIDDLQWLDVSSARALAYALRRLEGESVALLATRRSNIEAPLDIRRTFDRAVELVEVGPLGEDELHRLLRLQGMTFPQPVLARLHAISGGNPFFALELARGVARHADPGEPLRVPMTLAEATRARVEALPARTRSWLLAAAALAAPTVSVVAATGPDGRGRDPLAAAVRAGVISVDGDRIRFTHPLLASAIYGASTPEQRRSVHEQLADVVADLEERAKHLALAAEREDASSANVLEAAGRRAHARGATHEAAFFRERAGRLTPMATPERRWARLNDAAENYAQSGDYDRARILTEDVIASAPAGVARGHALHAHARIRSNAIQPAEWLALQEEARREAQGDPKLVATIERGLVTFSIAQLDFDGAARHARASLAAAEEAGDDVALAAALAGVAMADFPLGRGSRLRLLERAVALEPVTADGRLWERPRAILAGRLRDVDRFERSRSLYAEARALAAAAGQEGGRAWLLLGACTLECLAARYDEAARYASEAFEANAELIGQPRGDAWTMVALVSVYSGDPAAARERLANAGAPIQLRVDVGCPKADEVAGFLELSLGDMEAAARQLEPVAARMSASGARDPSLFRFVPDLVEALVGVGRHDDALAELERFEQSARGLGRVSALATAARCRGLAVGATGDCDRALGAFEDALRRHDRVVMPFERARTLLALGTVLRRAKQRQAARRSLDEALLEFERLGTPLWADKAKAELGRIGGRRPNRDGLTATEQRIAALVADGLTNREIADRLFVTVKTVEGTLSRVYSKLGLRSRTELTARMIHARGDGVTTANTRDSSGYRRAGASYGRSTVVDPEER